MIQKRFGKNDAIFFGCLIVILLLLCLVYFILVQKPGKTVLVTVDGEEYGSYDLADDAEIDIIIDGQITNHLSISEGYAKITKANCPDLLCVHQKKISKENESIVCLPNRIIVKVIGGEDASYDAIVQ